MDFRQALNLDPTNQLASQYLESTMQQEEDFQIMVRRTYKPMVTKSSAVLALDRKRLSYSTCSLFAHTVL